MIQYRFQNMYEVVLHTKHGKHPNQYYMINVDAYNMKEAKELVKQLWSRESSRYPYEITIRRVDFMEGPIDYLHWFQRIGYKDDRAVEFRKYKWF